MIIRLRKPGCEEVAIVDFDNYAMIDLDFVPGSLLEKLDSLHETANSAFRAAVIAEARKHAARLRTRLLYEEWHL